jgi:hypothetical protein
VLEHRRIPDHHHLLVKGDDMAVSNVTRKPAPTTNHSVSRTFSLYLFLSEQRLSSKGGTVDADQGGVQ